MTMLGLCVLLLFGCAADKPSAPPGSYRSEDFARPQAGSLLLVLHVPAATLAFRPGDALVASSIQAQLAGAGYRVGLVSFEDYALLVRDELAALAPSLSGDQRVDVARAESRALSRLAKIGGSTNGAVLLVSTRLVLRETELWQSYGAWDGQKRAIQFSGGGGVRANIQGTGPGLSVELLAHDANGRLRLKAYGGASLPYIASGNRGDVPLPRDDLFKNGDEITQGVQLALVQLLRQ